MTDEQTKDRLSKPRLICGIEPALIIMIVGIFGGVAALLAGSYLAGGALLSIGFIAGVYGLIRSGAQP